MSEFQVLSAEEVDALLKVTQEKTNDLSQVVNQSELQVPVRNNHALSNITELMRVECEKTLSSFFRKKIIVKSKSSNVIPLSAAVNQATDKNVYSAFHIMPQDRNGIFAIDLAFLHQTINLLYGGQNNANDPAMENPGKIGIVIAEKICQLAMVAFIESCKDYGSFTCNITKTTSMLNLITNMSLEDQVYMMEMSVFFDEIETTLKMMVVEEFFTDLIPVKVGETKHREKDFWREAIKSQVVDSMVTINVTLPDVTLKVKDFFELKEGDVIPISDPTLVYICLNNLKLFKASAGQSNSKRVAKVIGQI